MSQSVGPSVLAILADRWKWRTDDRISHFDSLSVVVINNDHACVASHASDGNDDGNDHLYHIQP